MLAFLIAVAVTGQPVSAPAFASRALGLEWDGAAPMIVEKKGRTAQGAPCVVLLTFKTSEFQVFIQEGKKSLSVRFAETEGDHRKSPHGPMWMERRSIFDAGLVKSETYDRFEADAGWMEVSRTTLMERMDPKLQQRIPGMVSSAIRCGELR